MTKAEETRQRMRAAGVYRYEVAKQLHRSPATISVWLKEADERNLQLIELAVDQIKEARSYARVGNI